MTGEITRTGTWPVAVVRKDGETAHSIWLWIDRDGSIFCPHLCPLYYRCPPTARKPECAKYPDVIFVVPRECGHPFITGSWERARALALKNAKECVYRLA